MKSTRIRQIEPSRHRHTRVPADTHAYTHTSTPPPLPTHTQVAHCKTCLCFCSLTGGDQKNTVFAVKKSSTFLVQLNRAINYVYSSGFVSDAYRNYTKSSCTPPKKPGDVQALTPGDIRGPFYFLALASAIAIISKIAVMVATRKKRSRAKWAGPRQGVGLQAFNATCANTLCDPILDFSYSNPDIPGEFRARL